MNKTAAHASNRQIAAPVAPDHAADQALVRRCQGGDEAAYTEIFQRYRARIYRLLLRFASGEDEALDLVQNTFLKAFRSLDQFRGDASFSTWLYRIATNVGIDHTRKRKNILEKTMDEEMDLDAAAWHAAAHKVDATPVTALEGKETMNTIEEAIRQLPDSQKTTFVLHAMEGMRYNEIAEVMACSIGTVMSRLYYARRKLQEALQQKMHNGRI